PGSAGRRVGGAPDRIERAGVEFHTRVADAYARLAALHPERIVVLDGALPAETIAEQVHDELRRPA
ncbi:MAG TPA: hypothetical protein VFY02_08085, partial [Gaiellaceae bacterium]|nr:hypothetical protein [Gaiellaceae bacterium]